MSKPAIVMNNLSRSFSRMNVLAHIDGAIEQGRTVGLLGRNGEGKTTLLRILLDILAPDTGTSSILEHPADGTGRVRLHTGYVPERPVFHEFFTAGEVLNMRSRIFPTWSTAKATELARRLELDLSMRVRGASKGSLAKTAWICATAHNPQVLLLDEPTSGLDALVRDSVLTHLVSELAEEGKTILVANHRMEEMLTVLDEVWLLAGGRIRARYLIEDLRRNAVRITGRLRSPRPPDLDVYEEHSSDTLVRWAVLNGSTVERIREQKLLDQMETESLPLDVSFKLLLAGKEGNHVR